MRDIWRRLAASLSSCCLVISYCCFQEWIRFWCLIIYPSVYISYLFTILISHRDVILISKCWLYCRIAKDRLIRLLLFFRLFSNLWDLESILLLKKELLIRRLSRKYFKLLRIWLFSWPRLISKMKWIKILSWISTRPIFTLWDISISSILKLQEVFQIGWISSEFSSTSQLVF